ncbi:hypothetical protein [Williamwhitmania taraxaci]|uniref:hypothetical protein n=1 Tax=Williamwhitmania taraxaci TaxID=1640674 RepID=UPI000B866B2C|nr:hypothetical protein [Williamwhitmania taraxaci]
MGNMPMPPLFAIGMAVDMLPCCNVLPLSALAIYAANGRKTSALAINTIVYLNIAAIAEHMECLHCGIAFVLLCVW